MAELNVRKLQTKDVFAVARIIKGCTSSARQSMMQAVAVSSDGEAETVNVDMQVLGFAVFEAAVDQEQEIKKLFADVAGMSVKALDESDYDTMLVILERLVEDNDLAGFFERALALGTKISGGSST